MEFGALPGDRLSSLNPHELIIKLTKHFCIVSAASLVFGVGAVQNVTRACSPNVALCAVLWAFALERRGYQAPSWVEEADNSERKADTSSAKDTAHILVSEPAPVLVVWC